MLHTDTAEMMGNLSKSVMIIAMLFCFLAHSLSADHSYEDVNALLTTIFSTSKYNRNIRPTRNQSDVTKVSISFSISSLESIDTLNGQVTVSGHLTMTWIDQLLIWDPALHGNITKLNLQPGTFWTPDIALMESSIEDNDITKAPVSPAVLQSNGILTWIPAKTFYSKCNIDILLYPFDEHTCHFTFVLTQLDSTEAMLIAVSDIIDTSNADKNPNGEWAIRSTQAEEVLHSDASSDISISSVVYTMIVARRYEFSLLHSLAPIYLLLTLNLIAYFVPVNSGERISYSVTIYLAFIFATTSTVDVLPRNSFHISYFSVELLIINCVTTMGVVWSVMQVRLSKRTEEDMPVPMWLKKVTLFHIRIRKNCTGTAIIGSSDSSPEYDVKSIDTLDTDGLETNANKLEVNMNNDSEITWLKVTETLDFFYFVFSCSCMIVVVMTMLILMKGNGAIIF